MRHKTSVLIVNSRERESKVRQVPTHIIMNWRKYATFTTLLVAALFLVAGFLIYQNTSRFYREKLERANYIRSRIDLKKALAAFASIDSGMYRINSFLEERGLERLKMKNMGGTGAGFDIIYINEFTDFYREQLLELEKALNSVPIGAPYGGKITSRYGYRLNPFTRKNTEFHSGIDFRGRVGDSVQCTGSGTVAFAGNKEGFGQCVIIQHNPNLQTLYGHLRQIHVRKGGQVDSGQTVGLLGNTGRSTGPHLHYEIIVNGKKINPEKYLNFEKKDRYD